MTRDGALGRGGFADPLRFELTDAAKRAARVFLGHCGLAAEGDWIVSFDWSQVRRLRRRGTNEWRDLGAGFDFAAYARGEVPPAAIGHVDGLDVLIKAPDALTVSGRRVIDFDETESRIVLR